MADAFVEQLRATVVNVESDAPLAPHTTLKVGGPAAALVRADSADDLVACARACAEHRRPWLVLGRGSNLLVADAGWPGVVIALGRGFRGVDVSGRRVVAGAAEPMPVLASRVARHQLAGLAFGIAIPGSVGGAVRMNAGAMGAEMRQVLEWADVVRLGRDGATERLTVDDLAMRYRHSALPADAVVVRAALRLRPSDPDTVATDMAAYKRWRRDHQPINEPSCGSVFRNPEGDSAGRLIDSAGLKGLRVGGAQVSDKHANFITVDRGATAADVHAVITAVAARVADVHSVRLETEVVVVGFDEGGPAPDDVSRSAWTADGAPR